MLFAKIAAPFALAAGALAQTFSVSTPASLIQCQPAQITWVGGTTPFILAAIPAGQPSAPAIAGIATGLAASPYTWNVNLPSGINLTLRLTDNTGAIAYSSPLVPSRDWNSSKLGRGLIRDPAKGCGAVGPMQKLTLQIQAGVSNACLNASASTSGLSTVSVSSASGSQDQLTPAETLSSFGSTTSVSITTTSGGASTTSSGSATTSAPSGSGSGSASTTSATSRPASSASSSAWAFPTAIAGVPAIAMAAIGGVAALL